MIMYPSAGWFLTYSTAIPPPAAKPTIKRIGLLGKFAAASPCALADCAAIATNTAATPTPSTARLNPVMGIPPLLFLAPSVFRRSRAASSAPMPPSTRDHDRGRHPKSRFDADARRVLGSRASPAVASPPADKP